MARVQRLSPHDEIHDKAYFEGRPRADDDRVGRDHGQVDPRRVASRVRGRCRMRYGQELLLALKQSGVQGVGFGTPRPRSRSPAQGARGPHRARLGAAYSTEMETQAGARLPSPRRRGGRAHPRADRQHLRRLPLSRPRDTVLLTAAPTGPGRDGSRQRAAERILDREVPGSWLPVRRRNVPGDAARVERHRRRRLYHDNLMIFRLATTG